MHDPSWSRRALLSAGALVPAGAVRSSAANSAVTIGLIGSGGRGTFDATLVSKHTGARVVALCDIEDERIERAKAQIGLENLRTYRNYEDLLKSDVDAVVIATPVFLHPEHLEAAIKAGKHVYVEKPAGADVEGCKRVMRAADAAQGRLNITFGFQQRYGPCSRKAHALVSSGALGPVRFAHSHWIKGQGKPEAKAEPKPASYEERLRRWKLWRDMYGDYIVETYCHGVDVLVWFMGGHPDKASGSGSQTLLKRGEHHDHCSVVFTWADGRQASLEGSQIAPLFHRDVHERFYFAESIVETSREHWKHIRSTTNATEERESRDITIDALQNFVNRVRDGKYENAGVSAAESTLTAILARTAMDRGREVTWKELVG